MRNRFRELPALVRDHPDFVWYVAARALGTGGRMATPYYIIYAASQGGLSGGRIGELTAAFLLAATASNLVWGAIADRTGFRRVMLWSLVVWVGATAWLLGVLGPWGVTLAMVGLGAGTGGFQMACGNLVMEFGERQELPMRIALAQTAEQVSAVVSPLLGAALVTTASYSVLFLSSVAIQLVAIVLLVARVREPRDRFPEPTGP